MGTDGHGGHAFVPRVQYATTDDGIRIAYTDTGRGPALVYLQPHSHTLREWELPETREWYSLLAERHRLIRLDIRHFGVSQRDAGPITVDTCVADVEAVVRRLGLERFDLMGISGLSAAAAAYAALHPDQVRRLVLWAAAATGAAWSLRERRIHSAEAAADGDPDLALELHSRFMFGERPPPRVDQQEFVFAAMGPEDLAEYMKCYQQMDVTGALPRIQAPTLVVHPRRSEYMPMNAVQSIAAAIPGAEFVDADTEMYPFLGPDLQRNLGIVEAFLTDRTATAGNGQQPGGSLMRAPEILSAREQEVLSLIAAGRTNQEAGETLGIAPSTVARHVVNIYAKAGVHNRAEATLWAVAHGVVNAGH